MKASTHPQDEDMRTLIDAAAAGLMGLALKALLKDGSHAAEANLDAVADGAAFIECSVLLTRRGVSAEGHFCSHGAKAHLFTVNSLAARKPGE